jgi:hypothetical protein
MASTRFLATADGTGLVWRSWPASSGGSDLGVWVDSKYKSADWDLDVVLCSVSDPGA